MKGVLYLIPVPLSQPIRPGHPGGPARHPSERFVRAEGHSGREENPDLFYPLLQETINSTDEFVVEEINSAKRNLKRMGYRGDLNKTIFHVLNEHTGLHNIEQYLASAEKGKKIGLMSEAGMPCIADPGSELVQLAHKKNIKVVPLYGPSSVFLALAASGLNGQNFCFHGYLPKSQSERKRKLKEIDKAIHTPFPIPRFSYSPIQKRRNGEMESGRMGCHIFIETPYRNNHLLEDILAVCSPETLLCVAANITSQAEKIITKTIAEWSRGELPDLNKQPVVFLLGK